MKLFGTNNSGSFNEVTLDTQSSQGAKFITGFSGGKDIFSAQNIIVVNFMRSRQEAVAHQRGLNRKTYTYVFGAEVGQCSVTAILYVGDCGSSTTGNGEVTLKDINEQYEKGRISKNGQLCKLALGFAKSDIIEGQLVGMDIGVHNKDAGLLSVTFKMAVIDDV